MAKKVLNVGDVHLHADHNHDRMEWLAYLALDAKPDVIVQAGDMEDMPSLSKYDIGKRSSHGHTYERDILAVIEGQKRFFDVLNAYNKNRKNKYEPELHLMGGNHGEGRIKQAANDDPKLYGTLSVEDFLYDDFGWIYHPYNEIVNIEGILYTHHFTDGAMDRPIGGKTLGNSLFTKKGRQRSMIQGHVHTLDLAFRTSMDGKQVVAGTIGCYFDYEVSYVSKSCQDDWWRGVVLFNNVENDEVKDVETISLDTIRREYSK